MPASRDLVPRQHDVGRGHHLALLDVQRQAGAGGGQQQVGLAAEEGGDLDDGEDLGGLGGLPGLVDVGEDGDAEVGLDAGQDGQPLFQPGAARRLKEERLALSNEALKMKGMPSSAVIFLTSTAISRVSPSSSMTQGPAIRKKLVVA